MNSSFFNPGNGATAMPTGSQGMMPRRSSYAAIVSGAASTSNSHQQQPGFPQWRHDQLWAADDDDMDDFATGPESTWRQFAEHRQLPHYSRAFQGPIDSRGPGGRHVENINSFFIPSYLRGTKYAKKLEETHRAKAAAKKSRSRTSSIASSTGADNLRKAPPHNGVTLELVEKTPPRNPDDPEPLPSRMSVHDKNRDVEVLADGLEINFIQCGDRKPVGLDGTSFSIRADATAPQESGIYYFEITVLTRNSDEDSTISIGLATKDMNLSRPVGWEKNSYGYHGDAGNSFRFGAHDKQYGAEFGRRGDTIGCGINFTDGTVWFTKNGANQGIAFRDIKDLKLFPTIGLKRKGEHVRVNFGQSPFVYDIDGRYKAEKAKIAEQIEETKTNKLAPSLDETSLIQSLVLQYLSHDGYVDTAEAFAQEVQDERTALTIDPKDSPGPFKFSQNRSARDRQEIRKAILAGDIGQALEGMRVCFPKVLEENRRTYFHLRLRQFIEMIKRDADANNGKRKETNGDADDWLSETMQQEMELDPPNNTQSEPSETDSYDRMETDEANGKVESKGNGSANGANGQADAVDAIQFGKQVKREFQLDADKEMKEQLEDAFALLSYENPEEVEDVNWMLKQERRVEVADELNSAILVSLGKAPAAALDRLVQQTTVLIDMLARQKPTGSPGTLINVDDYMKPEAPPRSFNH